MGCVPVALRERPLPPLAPRAGPPPPLPLFAGAAGGGAIGSAEQGRGVEFGGGSDAETISDLRAQLAHWQTLNAELYAMAVDGFDNSAQAEIARASVHEAIGTPAGGGAPPAALGRSVRHCRRRPHGWPGSIASRMELQREGAVSFPSLGQ